MDPPTHMLTKDSNFSFDSLASILTSPYFMYPRKPANDSEFGFDPHPSMTSLPKYVSPSKIHDGGNARSKPEVQENGPFQEGTKIPRPNKASACKHAEASSYLEACKRARPYKDASSHVMRHGQITPPMSTSSVSDDIPEVVKCSARNGASPRKSHQPQTDLRAASAYTSFVSSSSQLNAKSITKASHRTGKTTTKFKPPARLPDDRKRKLSLEKNKIAAANCRMKKQKREHCLKVQSRELVSKNTILKQSVSDMTQHLQELQSMLQLHVLNTGCYKPADIQEALGEQSSGYSLSSMSLCDDDTSESMKSLGQDSSTLDSCPLPDMGADDWYLTDIPPLESFSPPWESLLPSLDLAEGAETTTPDLANSIFCDSVGS